MKIAITGSGNLGRTLGTAWRTVGHDVFFGVQNPGDRKYASLGSVHADEDTAPAVEVVVVCTTWQSPQKAVQSCGGLAGKAATDAANPPVMFVCGDDDQAKSVTSGLVGELGFGLGLLRGRS